ncbi:MAG: PDZ domain-containing protein, partial [Ferrovibrio sp.]
MITSFDGKAIASTNALTRSVAETPVGKSVNVDIVRKGKKQTVKATLGELEAAMASAKQENSQKADANKSKPGRNETELADLGLRVAPLTKELRQKHDIKDDVKGVVVTDVDSDGPAAKRDVRVGDVIIEMAQSEIRNADDAVEMLKALKDAKRKVA